MRLPFLSASIIPYLIGAAYVFYKGDTDIFTVRFFIGLCAVIFSHIGANILNDYADSKSGNDWIDKNEHIYFGGSKVIQNGIFAEKQVFKIGSIFIILAVMMIVLLQCIITNIPIILFGVFILFLAVSYSLPPLKFAYRGIGEFVIFMLFGSVIVAGAYTIITMKYFDLFVIVLSFPISFLVTAILYCNEVPDYEVDEKVGKNTIVVCIGLKNAYWGYCFLIIGVFMSIILCVLLDILPVVSLFLLFAVGIYIKPFLLIKNMYNDIEKLKIASKLTIMGHSIIGIGIIFILFFST